MMRARLARGLFILWMAISIPVVGVFVGSEYVRFTFLETVAHWYSKIGSIKYVFVGDSLTSAGRTWGWRLERNPLISRNLGVSGFTVRQVGVQVGVALTYDPRYIIILAGTNDVLDRAPAGGWDRQSLSTIAHEFETMLDRIRGTRTRPIVTLVPYTAHGRHSILVSELNERISEICRQREVQVIDLNPKLAPERILDGKYTTDGVHFSEAAYDVWVGEILRSRTQ